MTVSEARRLKELEAENAKLKRLLADAELDKVSPQLRREAVDALMSERGFGVTRACGLVRISRSLYRYRSKRPECAELKARISEIAEAKRRHGYPRPVEVQLGRRRYMPAAHYG